VSEHIDDNLLATRFALSDLDHDEISAVLDRATQIHGDCGDE
jgi:hypothetical protein